MANSSPPRLSPLGRSTRSLVDLLMETYQSWRADRAIRLGAGLAYYAVFAAVPLVTTAIAIAGLIFSESEIRDFLMQQLTELLSADIGTAATDLAETIDTPSTISSLGTLGLISGIFAASVLFVALQDAFNVVWGFPVERGFRQKLRRRVVAFAVVLLAGALLLAVLLVQTFAVFVDELFPGEFENLSFLNDLIVSGSMWTLAVLALAVLFRLLVRQPLSWQHVLVASGITAILSIAGTWALGFYFERFGSLSVGGVLGSLLVILVWLYYESQIVIGGAELLKVLDRRGQPASTG